MTTVWTPLTTASQEWNHDGDTLYVDNGYVNRWYFAEEDSTPQVWGIGTGGSAVWGNPSLPTTNWIPVSLPTTTWL